MVDYGVTDTGFKRKTREEIVDSMQQTAKNLFGEDINLNDNSPLGKFIDTISYQVALAWQGQEGVYNSAFVNEAEGQALDLVCKYIGIQRKSPSAASGYVTFNGDEGTFIEEGFLVETDTDDPIQFKTIESDFIDSSGSLDLLVEAVEKGVDGNVSSGTITSITNPISGLDSINNSNDFTGGQDREPDYALRERYKESVSNAGASTIDSIRASIYQQPDVRSVYIRENNTDEVDSDGLPPKSIGPVVLGGIEDDIAQAILDTKAAGIRSFGDISTTVEDNVGGSHLIEFSRPNKVNIYVDVTLDTNPAFPENGSQLVETEVIKYIGGTTADGNTLAGLNVGEDVIDKQLIKSIMNITGIDDFEFAFGTSDNPTNTDDITIGEIEIAETSPDYVDVSIS